MANIFNQKIKPRIKKSTFNLGHDVKLSCDMGNLIPVNCMEILPGDFIRQNSAINLRFAPLLTPLMHEVNCDIYTFFCPSRILWQRRTNTGSYSSLGWEEFITGGPEGSVTGSVPAMTRADIIAALPTGSPPPIDRVPYLGKGSLWDYLGLPPFPEPNNLNQNNFSYNTLPFRAYQMVFNEYFRNETLQDPSVTYPIYDHWGNSPYPTSDPSQLRELLRLRQSNWERDYFTSALPWPQRGATVYIPGINPASPTEGTYDNLRTGGAIKRWMENSARAGSRYIEHLISHWGTRNGDDRLNRPEFCCGSRTPIFFNEVLQTSSSDSTSPQGNMSGHGQTISAEHKFSKFCPEHGYMITLMTVRPRTAYQDGAHRMFLRSQPFDFPFPEFAHLSEQEVYEAEIIAPHLTGDSLDNIFGYTGRYNEMRYLPSRVAGEFRDTLDYWHESRKFVDYQTGDVNQPALNGDFVSCIPDTRIFAVEDSGLRDSLYVHCRHFIHARRPLPRVPIPSLKA